MTNPTLHPKYRTACQEARRVASRERLDVLVIYDDGRPWGTLGPFRLADYDTADTFYRDYEIFYVARG